MLLRLNKTIEQIDFTNIRSDFFTHDFVISSFQIAVINHVENSSN